MKTAVAGTGYVVLSKAILLTRHNEVAALDIKKNPKTVAFYRTRMKAGSDIFHA